MAENMLPAKPSLRNVSAAVRKRREPWRRKAIPKGYTGGVDGDPSYDQELLLITLIP